MSKGTEMQQRAEPSIFLRFLSFGGTKKKITKKNYIPWPPSVITLIGLASSSFLSFFLSFFCLSCGFNAIDGGADNRRYYGCPAVELKLDKLGTHTGVPIIRLIENLEQPAQRSSSPAGAPPYRHIFDGQVRRY